MGPTNFMNLDGRERAAAGLAGTDPEPRIARARLRTGVLLAVAMATLLQPLAAMAQSEPERVRGTIGIGQTLIDEDGDPSLVRERADQYEGFAFRDVSLHALAPYGVRIDLYAPRLDPIGHDARLNLASRFCSGSVRTARNHFFFDPSGSLRSQRDQLTADLQVRPVRHVELFGEYAQIDLMGRRQTLVPGEEGELGTSYDQDTDTWRGGVRLDGLRSNLEVSYLGRQLESRVAPAVDRHVRGLEVRLRTRPYERLSAEGTYGWSRTRLASDSTPLESERVSGRFDFDAGCGFAFGPVGRFEESSDLSLGVRSHIWALGLALRAAQPRWWGDLEADAGQRENNLGSSKVRGLRATGGVEVAEGLTLQGIYRLGTRHRLDIDSPPAPLPPLVNVVGTLRAQRVEGRLRYRAHDRWSAEALVARFDKDYDDVRVEQQTWRYGLQGSAQAVRGVRVNAGWRLDDAFDVRSTGRYDLRTETWFGGADVTAVPRLTLRGRADTYRMSRRLDEWKLLVTASGEYEVVRDLFLGVAYERDRFEDEADSPDYRANVWQIFLRHAFGI